MSRKQLGRKSESRAIREYVLIVTNGEQTENNYFNEFPYNKKNIYSKGIEPDSLVDFAVKKRAEYIKKEGNVVLETWCVFDKDESEKINAAINKAGKNKIHIALTNECFELWLFLHYEYTDSPLGRNQFEGKLSKMMGKSYKKNDAGIYKLIVERQLTAIKNAKKLERNFPDNPSTRVYKLVERLNELNTLD